MAIERASVVMLAAEGTGGSSLPPSEVSAMVNCEISVCTREFM